MINEDICKLREKLNESIQKRDSYEKIYIISTELDDLIMQYYSNQLRSKK